MAGLGFGQLKELKQRLLFVVDNAHSTVVGHLTDQLACAIF